MHKPLLLKAGDLQIPYANEQRNLTRSAAEKMCGAEEISGAAAPAKRP
jgi:hypothetical protein